MEGQGEGREDAGMKTGQGREAERENGSERERESKMEIQRKTGERETDERGKN